MNHKEFEEIFFMQVKMCEMTLVEKAKEYATEDHLHNFKVAGTLQGTTPRIALGGMLAKHVISIFDMIQKPDLADINLWNEKIGDAMNYLFLLKAVIVEEQKIEIASKIISENSTSRGSNAEA